MADTKKPRRKRTIAERIDLIDAVIERLEAKVENARKRRLAIITQEQTRAQAALDAVNEAVR
jgi:hypothetical protein